MSAADREKYANDIEIIKATLQKVVYEDLATDADYSTLEAEAAKLRSADAELFEAAAKYIEEAAAAQKSYK